MSKTIQFIQVTPEELKNAIIEGVKLQLEDIKNHLQPKEPTKYLTRNEVSEMLSCNLSSVHNYTKRKILQSYQIGSRVYYKRDEVENSFVKLNK
jgi:ubiquinone biosynthesis protein COQ9